MKKKLKVNSHDLIPKKWGHEIIYYNKKYCFKELCFQPKAFTSMHKHKKKKETFVAKDEGFSLEYVDSVTNISYKIPLLVNQSYTLKPNTWHRICNDTNNMLTLIEVSTHHSDFDVRRME